MNRTMTGNLAGVIDDMLSGNVAGSVNVQTPQGSTDYTDLDNKPSINNVTLEGNKTTSELGLFSGDYNDLDNKPTIPSEPVIMIGATSENAGSSGYVPQPLAGDQNKFLNGAGEWTTPQVTPLTNYTLNEVIFGTWVDGKPIYRKGFSLQSLTYSTSWQSFAHNISNLGRIINCYGSLINTSDSRFYTFPQCRASSDDGIVFGFNSEYVYYINDWLQTTSDVYFFMEYTKIENE